MGRFVDRVCIGVALFILTFVVVVAISHDSILSLIVSTSLSILIIVCIAKTSNQHQDNTLSFKQFDTYIIIKGIDTFINMLHELYSEYELGEHYLIHDDTMIMPIFKFSTLSRDDVLKTYRIAQNKHAYNIYIISNNIDRQAILFANILYDVSFHFVRSKEVYKALQRHHLLPVVPRRYRRARISPTFALSTIFNRYNAPRFLFSSCIMLIIAFIVPMRIYYFILSAISALLSLVCIFSSSHVAYQGELPEYNKKDLSDHDKS